MSAKNQIRKQIVELQLDPQQANLAMQQQAADWCRMVLLPQLEKTLEKYAQIEQTIRLEKIEVELKVGQVELNEVLVSEIVGRIEDEIEKQRPAIETAPAVDRKEASLVESLLFYLQHGFLPWWTQFRSIQDFHLQWKNAGSSWLTKGEKKAFSKVLQSSSAVHRLLALEDVFPLVFTSETAFLASVTSKLATIDQMARFVSADERPLYRRSVKHILLMALVEKNEISLSGAVEQAVVKVLQDKYGLKREILPDFEPLLQPEARKVFNQVVDGNGQDNGQGLPKQQPDETTTATLQKEKEEGIYISNAGLVIVAPYLTRFFTNTGIVSGQGLNSTDLAVALMHWMVTGNDEYAEFETVLPKILCGLEPEDNITIVDAIPALFKTEATEMLQSLISHWTVLKQTTVEGLQASFLQREGKLSFRGNHWLLQVEQKSYDMLLEHLPWSIGMIKLPWMKHFLQTEWM